MKYEFVDRPKPTDPTDPVQVAAYTGYSVGYVRQLLAGIRRGQLPPWGAAPRLIRAGVVVQTCRPLSHSPLSRERDLGPGDRTPGATIRGARRPRPSRRGCSPSSASPKKIVRP
jgi:hypothetical protein